MVHTLAGAAGVVGAAGAWFIQTTFFIHGVLPFLPRNVTKAEKLTLNADAVVLSYVLIS